MRCPEKPKTKTAIHWYDWSLKTAVATRAKKGGAIMPPEVHRLPPACARAISAGWDAGIHAVEVIERLKEERSPDYFELTNEPNRKKAPDFHDNEAEQKTLLSGLDCLPGQEDLFPDLDAAK